MEGMPITVWGNMWENQVFSLGKYSEKEQMQRGRELANAGKVSGVVLRGGWLEGTVKDGEVSHKVSVSVPTARKKELDTFFKRMRYHWPRLKDLRQHSDHSFIPEAWNMAREAGMRLFPWDTYLATYSCSCGRHYMHSRCEHVYALLFAAAFEVNSDPALLFELNGFYIRYAINKMKMGPIRNFYQESVPTREERMRLYSERRNTMCYARMVAYKDFPNRTDLMLSLLMDDAMFDSGFKTLYLATYRRMMQALQRVMDGKRSPSRLFPRGRKPLDLAAGAEMPCELFSDRWQNYALTAMTTPWEVIPQARLTAQVNWYAFHSALALLQAGGFAPCLMSDDNYNFFIYWMPNELHESTRQVLFELGQLTPDSMVYLVDDEGVRQYVEEPARWMLASYANLLVDLLAPRDRPGTYQDMFFHGKRYHIRFSYERRRIYELSGWLAPYQQLVRPPFRPYLLVEEAPEEGGFHVSAAIVPNERPDEPPTLVSTLVERHNADVTDPIRFYFVRLLALMPDIQRTGCNYNQCAPMFYDGEQMIHFLDQVVPTLQYLGVQVLLPKSLQELLKPRLSLRLRRNDEDEESSISIDDLLAYDWVLAVGDEQVDAAEFEQMLQQNNSLLRFKSRYIVVRKEELSQYRDAILGGKLPVKESLMHAALAEDYDDHPVLLTPEACEVIRRATTLAPVPLPEGLQATLRPYQERGYAWLYRNMRLGFGSILADDMGLGKTLQTIALILKLKEEGRLEEKKALIVVPTSLLTNWQAEVARFAPSLSVSLYHGSDRSQQAFAADITLTTYGVARGDMEVLNLYPWRLLVVDEAQNIKNAATKQTRAIVNIKADCRIALSGTPVENRLAEFWSIMQFCNPGYLGSQRQFSARYAKPIQVDKDEFVAERFRRITGPFLLRRLKTDKDIIDDLPDKIEKNEYVSLLPSQAALYQAVVDEAMKTLRGLDTDDVHHLFKRKGIILQMILALKQVCNHPAQYLKNDDLRPEISGKTEHLLELVQRILDAGEKVLIFSQFKQMGEMLVRFIQERLGEEALFYHGGCTVEQRAELVRRFQEDPADRVFVLSLKAAGTGLNLTAATHVVHYDLWWNPAVESQATDRAYRIGQHQNVIVHRFITHNTFEEKIDSLIQDKRRLADITVASGEGWIADLSDDELRELFDNF